MEKSAKGSQEIWELLLEREKTGGIRMGDRVGLQITAGRKGGAWHALGRGRSQA